MARLPRSVLPASGVFHITNRGVNRCSIFVLESEREWFVAALRKAAREHRWIVHAYCLMGNHFHVIVEGEMSSISAGFQRITGHYASLFNRRHGRVGHLFQGRFQSRVVSGDEHLTEACHYVWNNPVRAGLCADAREWRWSGRIARLARRALRTPRPTRGARNRVPAPTRKQATSRRLVRSTVGNRAHAPPASSCGSGSSPRR